MIGSTARSVLKYPVIFIALLYGQAVLAEDTHGYEYKNYKLHPLIVLPNTSGRSALGNKRHNRIVTVIFSPELDFTSIKASLNGLDVTSLFMINEPGIHNIIIPFIDGENILEVEASPKKDSIQDVLSSLSQIHRLSVVYEPLMGELKAEINLGVVRSTPNKTIPPGKDKESVLREKPETIMESFQNIGR